MLPTNVRFLTFILLNSFERRVETKLNITNTEVKNTKFNFLKNLNIFPMEEVAKPKNFNENLNFKISNMNMNIKIQYKKNHEDFPSSNWIDQKKLDNYLLPTFTKKIVQYLESN